MSAEIPCYTSEELAPAIGLTPRQVRNRLATVEDFPKFQRGQMAKAWRFDALPEDWRARLLQKARDYGFRDVPHLLNAGVDLWQPRHPIADIDPAFLDKAAKLQRAMAGTLARINAEIPPADFNARGLADFNAAFGYTISLKQWHRLLARTLARAGASAKWDRLEIYLDDDAKPKAGPMVVKAARLAADHRELLDYIRSFATPLQPTAEEKRLLWMHSFDRCDDLMAGGMTDKAARRAVVEFLATHAPYLAKHREALAETFKDKRARWIESGRTPDALQDGRAAAGAARRKEIPEEDKKTLLAFASKFGGGIAQGWREAREAGALSFETSIRGIENPSNKSHVPRAIREAVKHDAAMLENWMRGPRKAKLGGAFIERDPNAFNAGDWHQGDDCTLPNYYWEDTGSGVRLMRGQVLAMIDVRTTYILGFVLISAGENTGSHYNAWHIRNLITKVHDCYGLPRKGFAFENGSWRAKLLTGNPAVATEEGLRKFGVRFIHSRLPRAKVIERVFGSIQNRLEAELGYCGRNEIVDTYERVKRQKQLVESGHEPPEKFFNHRDEWIERLTAHFEHYNREAQNGKYCPGISPTEAFERYAGNEPIVRLPDTARYLLANDVKRLRVGRNGISFTARGERFTYKNGDTGALLGREVECYFQYEDPAILGVKDPSTGKVFAVRRATLVPGMDAPAETIGQAERENSEHAEYARALYRSITPKFSAHFMSRPHFRAAMVDRETAATAEALEATRAAEVATDKRERKTKRKATAAAQRIGAPLPDGPVSERRADAMERLSQLLAKDAPEPNV